MSEDKKRPLPRDAEYYNLDGTPVDGAEAFNEIASAIMRLRAAFIKHGFQPIKSLELGDHRDGYRMRHILPREMIMATPSESLRDPNDTDVVFNVMGVELRYPAGFRRLRKGKTEIL